MLPDSVYKTVSGTFSVVRVQGLNEEHTSLKSDTAEVAKIRKTVSDIMRGEKRNEETITKKRGMEL